ncbi:hypothetical protein DFS34DRAFT_609102 [Phlyctochytrium arcticum]|nr:hypothetical protein DFS34DRAFT_609102 [Phlyctochytrium arcticum]
MVACKYFLQGTCRYGNSCHYEHTRGQGAGFGTTGNSFGGGGGGGGTFGAAQNSSTFNQGTNSTSVRDQTIISDLTGPESAIRWPFSSYGFDDIHLLSDCELSFEEARWDFYNDLKSTGQTNNAASRFREMAQNLNNRLQEIIRNPTLVINQAVSNAPQSFAANAAVPSLGFNSNPSAPNSGFTSNFAAPSSVFTSNAPDPAAPSVGFPPVAAKRNPLTNPSAPTQFSTPSNPSTSFQAPAPTPQTLSDMDPDFIAAFAAPAFEFGKIPTVPPPMEFR